MESVRRFTWAGVLAAMTLGLVWDLPGRAPHWVLQGLLMSLLFLSCLELRFGQVLREARRGLARNALLLVVVILASPLMLLPFRGAFDGQTWTGMILAGTMSTGLGVIFLADVLNGSPSRALVLAVLSSVLAPLTVPVVVSVFASRTVRIDALAMSVRTAFIVLLPLAAAMATGPTALGRRILQAKGPVSLAIFFGLIVTLVSSVSDLVLQSPARSLRLLGVVAALSVACALMGVLIGRGARQRMTFAIVASYRNFTLATVLALTLFGDRVAIPCVIYVLAGNLMVVALQLSGRALALSEASSASRPEAS